MMLAENELPLFESTTAATDFVKVKVTVTWHKTKFGDPYSEFVLCI